MATAAHIPVEVYLHSSYEPDAEYVDGAIEERAVGELDHAAWQMAISAFFLSHAAEWKVRVFAELRVQVSSSRFRVADVLVLDRSLPLAQMEQIVRQPPLAVFEILSPEDRMTRVLEKCADYERMGVKTVMVINLPGPKYRYQQGLEPVESLEIELPGAGRY